MIRFALLSLLVFPTLASAEPSAAEKRKICESFGGKDFRIRKTIAPERFDPPSRNSRFTHRLRVNFASLNSGTWLGENFNHRDANRYLDDLRRAFNQCGVEVELGSVLLVDGPDWLNGLDWDHDGEFSEEEKCLIRPVKPPGEVTVFFVGGVVARGDDTMPVSHAWAPSLTRLGDPKDKDLLGSAVVASTEQSNPLTKIHVVAHEVGHVVLDESRPRTGASNLMSHDASMMSFNLDREQCARLKRSPFVKPIQASDAICQWQGRGHPLNDQLKTLEQDATQACNLSMPDPTR